VGCGEISTLLSLSYIFTSNFAFNFMQFNFTQQIKSLLFNLVKFRLSNLVMKPLQFLRLDILNIALSYGIRPIASGSFIIDNFLS
jgi:hypothetical protein